MLTYHFPPSAASGSFRLMGFARHLPSHGWRSTVVAPPSLPWEPVDPALCDRLPAGTVVCPVPYPSRKVIRKFAPLSGWLPGAWRACKRVVRNDRPDAILTSGPPQQVHWLGLMLKKRYNIPWLADFRDPWYPEGRMNRGEGFARWNVERQEAAVFAAADAVIANAPGACAALRADYPRHRQKFVTLPNGYDRESFAGAEGPPPTGGRPLKLVHTGAIYVGRDPRPVFDAMRNLSSSGRASLCAEFFGPKPESDLDLAAEITMRGLQGRVVLHGQVTYARCLDAITSADIVLLMDTPGRTVGVPAKLYEYLGAGRPILALGESNGDLAWVLSRSGVPYRIVPPGDPLAVTSALGELAREASAYHDPSPRVDLHRFSREAIAGRLAAVLDRCTGATAGPGDADDDSGDLAAIHEPSDEAITVEGF